MAIPKPTIQKRVEYILINKTIADTNHDGCWTFTGYTKRGYGYVMHNRKNWLVHRLVYTALVGEIPEGMTLDHTCENPACVNPKHLEPVTRQENLSHGKGFAVINSQKTHCSNGHEYTEANTYTPRSGGRHCRECRKKYTRSWNARQTIRTA